MNFFKRKTEVLVVRKLNAEAAGVLLSAGLLAGVILGFLIAVHELKNS